MILFTQNQRVKLLLAVLFTLHFSVINAQSKAPNGTNYVQTAVPFLTIAPDSRAGGMGDTGAATSPDANSMHWNPSKFCFIKSESGISVSYVPWLKNLVNDISLTYLSGFHKLDDKQAIAGSLKYFSLGSINFFDENSDYVASSTPNEFAIDAAYSRKLSDNLSGSIAFRYIRSDIVKAYNNDESTKVGQAFATDISLFYKNYTRIEQRKLDYSIGLNISNIGSKISYTEGNENFLPMNLKLGTAFTYEIDEYNKFTASIDFNKLLVTYDYYEKKTVDDLYKNGNDYGVIEGIFKSFSDSEDGFIGELREINISGGLEYIYQNQFAIRAGYFHEHEVNGNRKFFTAGVGIKFNVFNLDMSYLVATENNNPLQNTLRFSLAFDLKNISKIL